ncbi:tetratricopeptide repeat protein [Salinisphaera sp.]|uniref:tetratricopeptide repeat protein n=1 Tax=Salinisphaera sp. TaxID=1914330 RepID=UPI002D78B43B|nr:tetratricopeptide repeat protein [Salinisphaera sp.]HET7312891.1 tetratricopeptide repeat protein [Salinisphaera sp.]
MAAVGLASVLGFVVFDTPARAAADDTRGAPVQSIDELASAPEADRDYHIMLGELALLHGDADKAAQAYVEVLAHSHDPALAQRATRIALAAGREDLAYQAAQTWARAAPKDVQAQRAAVRLAFVNADSQGVQRFAPGLVASADSVRDGYEMLSEILSGRPDQADMALDAMRRLASAHPDRAAAQYALGRLALNYNRVDEAARAADRAVAAAPDWDEASLLRAALEVRQGKPKAASKRVDALEGSARQRAEYHVALARMLLAAGNDAAGLAAAKKAVAIDGDFAQARYGLGLVALSQGDLATAAAQFEHLYKAGARADDAAFYRGVVAEQKNQDANAIDWYKKVDDGDHRLEARVRIAQLTYRQGDLEGARRQLHALAERHPDQSDKLRAVEGGLLVDAGQLKAALAVYDKALEDAPDSSDLRYARSLVYEKLGRIDDAEADLKHILSQDADNPEALNALGYMLTNHSTDYARAERYIRKSLAAAPGNPAVLDSLGWVEYKRGHLDAAREHLEKAYQGSPDPEIAAHLGEVRWKQGDHDAAREIWHKAQAQHPDNAVLERTIKRLTS